MTRNEFVESIRIGHNLGNGLECIEPKRHNNLDVTVEREVTDINGYHDFRITIKFLDGTYDVFYNFEELWSNVPVTQEWFNKLKDSGVQAVRIPVNLTSHVIYTPSCTIDPLWLKRVREVIEMAMTAGLKCILTLHSDFEVMYNAANYPSLQDPMLDPAMDGCCRIMTLWKQMAEYVNDISTDELAFELTNEFQFTDLEETTDIDTLCDMAVVMYRRLYTSIRSVGGNASERFLLIGGYRNDPRNSTQKFADLINNEFDDKCILTGCFYTPWQFTVCDVFQSWEYAGNIKTDMDAHLASYIDIQEKYGIPIIITEYGVGCEAEGMQKKDKFSIINFIYSTAKMLHTHGFASVIWDPGYLLRRDNMQFSIPFWDDMITAITTGQEFDIPNAYDTYADQIAFERCVIRTGMTLEEVQALDNISTDTEEE